MPAIPQRLYLMQLSTTTIPLAADQTLAMSSGCYLVQTSDKKNILIDSGLPADYTPPPGTPPAEHEKNVLEHLADLGLHPDDITLLICTHFDVDHAGYHDAFPKAELIVQREHYELARSGHARFAAARAHWDQPTLHYRLIEGDTELLPGLTLLETSGHAPGHQSVLVRSSWRLMPLSSNDSLPRIAGPGQTMRMRSNCAPARENFLIWSSASTSRWSSLAMMVSSGKRLRKHLSVTNDEGMSQNNALEPA
jgi:Metallo-beta-lactamase superfamily